MAELAFDTTVNYQKIYLEGSAPLSIANPNATASVPVTHGLGYVPNVRVWFTNASGKICPALGDVVNTLVAATTTDFAFHQCRYKVNTTTLTITFDRLITVGATVSTTIYYRIYLDSI